MGVAVAAASGVFSGRDFHPRRPRPVLPDGLFQGYFASLVHVNSFLAERPVTARRKKSGRRRKLLLSTL